jgi:MazG family protein
MATWDELVGLVRRLRAPGGCPWDREQTHRSLRRYALEEAREVVAAIDDGDMHALADELGDLLLQVLLHAVIAEEAGDFGPSDVLGALADKLVRRHPHVFGEAVARDAAEVRRNREALKRAERPATDGLLDDVPRSLPALVEAQRLGRRASGVGFDWGDAAAAWEKVREEGQEFASAWLSDRTGDPAGQQVDPEAVAEEMGDLFFALANVARLIDVDAEAALTATNDKFRRRFAHIEAAARAGGRTLTSLGLEEMEALWQEAKREGKEHGS